MDQFKNITEWKNQWNQFFGEEFWSNFEPHFDTSKSQLNMYQAENELIVVLSLPGLARVEDITIYVQYQTLSVKGKINLNFKGYELIQEGIVQGEVVREIQLPFAVREDRIDASYKRGLVIIHLHKLIPDETRKKIAVKDEDK